MSNQANNYWRWLKRKLKQENPQLVSATHQLKLTAPDGKKRLTDKINDREIFMKGIDYSYYYEENSVEVHPTSTRQVAPE